jgi:hypothetical protein
VLVSWFEGTPRNHIDSHSQQFLKVLEQADVIKKRGTGLEIHQQVKIAARVRLPASNRPENSNPMGFAFTRHAQDLRAASA